MNIALIKLTKKIILDNNNKHPVLRSLYRNSVEIVVSILDSSSIQSWHLAIPVKNLVNETHRILNSEENPHLKRLPNNFKDLAIGTKNAHVEILEGRIEVIDGNISDKASFKFNLYILLQEFTLLNCIGNSLLVSIGNQVEHVSKGIDTFLLPLNDEYNISYYKMIDK